MWLHSPEMKLFVLTPTFGIVIPAKAGSQCTSPTSLDSRLRGNDGGGTGVAPRFYELRGVAPCAMDN